jgi:hypothetical protein
MIKEAIRTIEGLKDLLTAYSFDMAELDSSQYFVCRFCKRATHINDSSSGALVHGDHCEIVQMMDDTNAIIAKLKEAREWTK